MKEKYKQKLLEDMIRYSKQIGIPSDETPRLVFDRREMWKILVENGMTKRAAGYGECFRELKTIFVDANIRVAQYRVYPMYVKVKGLAHRVRRHGTKKKATYRDIRHTLVHELVHYRFIYMKHGVKYEERIREILRGKVFPEKSLGDNTTPPINNNIPNQDTTTTTIQEEQNWGQMYYDMKQKYDELCVKVIMIATDCNERIQRTVGLG